MLRTIGLKLAHIVPVLFLVSLATFFMIELIPGDAALAIAGPQATEESVEQVRRELGLDTPIVERYFDWLGDTLTGDFGNSFTEGRQAVSDMITQRLPITLEIALVALGMSLLIAIPTALISASRPNGPPDRVLTAGAFGAISLPSFLVALLLIFFLIFERSIAEWFILAVGGLGIGYYIALARRTAAQYPPGSHRTRYLIRTAVIALAGSGVVLLLFFGLPTFPRTGFSRLTAEGGVWENVKSVFLPAMTLALIEAATFMRVLRSDLITTLQEDFILAARAKGMPRWRVLFRDALRPSSFSIITIAGVGLGRAMGGTVIVEQIFAIAGLGTLMITSINGKDIPVVQTTVLMLAVFYVVINAAVDIAYGYLDPRIRRGRI